MVAEGILLGPFTGGLNLASDPASVQDLDLTICQNMELDLDGALRNRYPFEDLTATMPGTGIMKLLGIYTAPAGANYLLGSNGNNSTYYFTGTGWVQITSSLAAAAMVQYKGKAWLIADPNTSQNGGSWDPVAGFAAVPGIPRGRTIETNKERLWVGPGVGVATNGARMTYSAVGAPTTWPDTPTTPGGGYFNVNDGDGQNIVNIIVYYSDILIFKERSTYRFTFNTDPGQGTLSRLSDTVGSAGQFATISYEGLIYVLFDDKVYSLTNYNFDRVSIKVPLVSSNPSLSLRDPYILSHWNDKLIVQYHSDTFVYSLRTQTWSTWVSSKVGTLGRVISLPASSFEPDRAYLMSNDVANYKLYRVSAEDAIVTETLDCRVRTKHYDYQSPGTFKKLAFWGADVISKVSVTGKVAPVVYAVPVTWGDIQHIHWGDLGTWGRLLDTVIDVTDTASISSTVGERKFIRYIKALRFRQVYFEVQFVTDGSFSQAPVKLFTLTTYVTDKQHVPWKVN